MRLLKKTFTLRTGADGSFYYHHNKKPPNQVEGFLALSCVVSLLMSRGTLSVDAAILTHIKPIPQIFGTSPIDARLERSVP